MSAVWALVTAPFPAFLIILAVVVITVTAIVEHQRG